MALTSLIVGVALLLLLLAVAVKGGLASRGTPEFAVGLDETGQEPCPQEYVSKIFSRDDWTYVRAMKSPPMEKLFREERKMVALVWVRQTSSGLRRIMGEHAAAARQSRDLEPATEMKIFVQFAALMLICAALRAGILLAGHMWIAGLARYAQRLAQRFAEAERAFAITTRGSKPGVVNSG
jgi:hypothetical protein